MVVTILQVALAVVAIISAISCFYHIGRKDGWREREEAYEAACFANQDAVERSRKASSSKNEYECQCADCVWNREGRATIDKSPLSDAIERSKR